MYAYFSLLFALMDFSHNLKSQPVVRMSDLIQRSRESSPLGPTNRLLSVSHVQSGDGLVAFCIKTVLGARYKIVGRRILVSLRWVV